MAPRHFINLEQWPAEELRAILALCGTVKTELKRGVRHSHLSGRNVGLIFEKASLRTRVSFEVGINQLGGNAIVLGNVAGRLGEREPIADFARVAGRYVDGLVVRTYEEAAITELASHAGIPVINALSDESHPCQAMGDMFTLIERWGTLAGKTLCYIGDSNNVARSLLDAASKLGLSMRVASPKGYQFPKKLRHWGEGLGFVFTTDPVEAALGADAVYTDVWTSMGMEKERKKRLAAFKDYQVCRKLIEKACPKALVMHCLPAHRGEEIDDFSIESPNSIVFDQAENRLHIQKAVLITLMRQ